MKKSFLLAAASSLLALSAPAQFSFTSLDFPGANGTRVQGISGNNIVGFYDLGGQPNGFIFDGSSYTTVNFPGAPAGTELNGISGNNLVGGYDGHGFFYNASTAATLDAPSGSPTVANGVSGSHVVGQTYINLIWHGFLYDGSSFSILDAPNGNSGTMALGVSGNQIVGTYYSNMGGFGFLYDGVSYLTLDAPHGSYTFATGISGNYVVGGYQDTASLYHGFIYDISAATYTTLDHPAGVNGTVIQGIDGNNIVGWYLDNAGATHGFLTSLAPVPEPTTLSLVAFSVFGLQVLRKKRLA